MDFGSEARIKKRRRVGLNRELETIRKVPPHPSIGGSRGYAVSFRISEIKHHENGMPTTASKASLSRWLTATSVLHGQQ